MGVYYESGSEFVCTSELYTSKFSVVFLKQMLICHPKSGIYVTLLTQPYQDYLQSFHPKNPPSVSQLFFTSLPSKHKYQPKRSTSFLSCLPKHQSLSCPSSVCKKAQWSLPGGFSNEILHGSFFSHKWTVFIYNSSSAFSPFLFLLLKKSNSQDSAKIWTWAHLGSLPRQTSRQTNCLID
jgi:hypothetical protein